MFEERKEGKRKGGWDGMGAFSPTRTDSRLLGYLHAGHAAHTHITHVHHGFLLGFVPSLDESPERGVGHGYRGSGNRYDC